MTSLIVRSDAGESVGLGHVIRCFGLAAAAVERGMPVTFVAAQPPPFAVRLYSSIGARICALDHAYPASGDLQSMGPICAEANSHAWVVVDGYHFDSAYHAGLQELGVRTLAVDDHAHLGHYKADILLNQNVGFSPRLYRDSAAGVGKMLIGGEYVLLRPEFRRERPPRVEPRRARKIGITVGGSDHYNVTSAILEQLAEAPELSAELDLRVVRGPLNPHVQQSDLLAARVARQQTSGSIRIESSVDDMAEFLEWCDVLIAAAGTTSWEACRIGVPSITFAYAANHAAIAAALHEEGAAINAGWVPGAAVAVVENLRSLVDDVSRRTEMAEAARRLIDGRGCDRVLDEMTGRAEP